MMNDMLSQEEIDALLNGGASEISGSNTQEELNDMEKDALGEIGNINMGTAATTLSMLLGKRVNITTPEVDMITMQELSDQYPIPFVAVQVSYREGLTGTNVLILKEEDVKIITSLMMGGDGKENLPGELDEIHLSAISEAMNQMVGSSSTSLSEMLVKKIDISPPEVFKMNLGSQNVDIGIVDPNEKMIRISFRMAIDDLIDSRIMQLLPIDFAKNLVDNMLYGGSDSKEEPKKEEPKPQNKEENNVTRGDKKGTDLNKGGYETPPQYQPQPNMPYGYEQPHYPYGVPQYERRTAPPESVNVQQVQFQNFDPIQAIAYEIEENIDLIRDVNLKVTVELGRTKRSIEDILDFSPGTIIELDKLVGEALDILVNGKKIAKGEVVVIDESYGVRITDILKPEKRLKSI